MVSAEEVFGKSVISTNGDDIGKVQDVRFDERQGQITRLQLKLTNKAAVSLGFKKTIGSYTVCMPIELISSIGDVITINKTLLDLASGKDIKKCIPENQKKLRMPI